MNARLPALSLLLAALAALGACETATSSATPGDFLKWSMEQGLRVVCAASPNCANRAPDSP